jgi:hypothetical protein
MIFSEGLGQRKLIVELAEYVSFGSCAIECRLFRIANNVRKGF